MAILQLAPEAALKDWLATLAKDARVLSPKRAGSAITFAPFTQGDELLLERATLSPKHVVMPQSETLVHFTATKNPENLASTSLELSVPKDAQATILFGCRPCDSRAIAELDAMYMKGAFKDPYYAARRDALTIVSFVCNKPCGTCFCNMLSAEGPASKEGSDVLMTLIGPGYTLEAITEKGEALLKDSGFADATEHMGKVQATRDLALKHMGEPADIKEAGKRLKERFADIEFWTAMTAKCLSCGACTYMCPTCQCFTITDEGDILDGKRLRSWDSCMSSLFTREASGHNPRDTKAMRMRNRISHKYWYIPENNNGLWGCTGCGRCIRQCPVAFNIREVLLAAIKTE